MINFNDKKAIYPIILTNLIPVIGIILLGWSLFSILVFYWLESLAIGFFNVLKMILVKIQDDKKIIFFKGKEKKIDILPILIMVKIFYIFFFCVHFGAFMFGHLFGIFSMASLLGETINISLIIYVVLIPSLFLLISHGYSFYTNYIKNKEYELFNLNELMFLPYKRVILMHFVIVFGSFIIFIFRAPEILAILFIFGKTCVDLVYHMKTHKDENGFYLGFDFSKKWGKLMQREKEKLGVKDLTTEQMAEIYKKINEARY